MQITIFSLQDQMPHPVDLDDALAQDFEKNIRIIHDGKTYALTPCEDKEIAKFNELRTKFETSEWPKLKAKYNYKDKEDVPTNFDKLFFTELDDENRKKEYAEFYSMIKEENKDAIYSDMMRHFLTYVFMINRYADMIETSIKERTDPSFLIDFANRHKKIFLIENFYNKLTIRQVSEALNDLRQKMDIDERRHAGYDRIIGGVSSLSNEVVKLLPKDKDNREFLDTVINFTHEKYGKLFKTFDDMFRVVMDYYLQLPDLNKKNIKAIRELDKDPVRAYLIALRNNVGTFLIATDDYLKSASKIEKDDKVQLNQIKDDYIKAIKKFYVALDYVYGAFDADTVKFDEDITKQFNALWESTVYYKNSGEGDWFLKLAKLLYKSYEDFFKSVLTEDDPVPLPEKEKSEEKTDQE